MMNGHVCLHAVRCATSCQPQQLHQFRFHARVGRPLLYCASYQLWPHAKHPGSQTGCGGSGGGDGGDGGTGGEGGGGIAE